jgi:hypothetical protein
MTLLSLLAPLVLIPSICPTPATQTSNIQFQQTTVATPFETGPGEDGSRSSIHGPQAEDNSLVAASGCDIAVISVRNPHGLIGGDGLHGYRVMLHNSCFYDIDVPVTVTVGPSVGNGTILVPALSTASGMIYVPTPASNGGCGDLNSFPVVAQSNYPDSNPLDDVCHSAVRVAVPFWDLEYEIVNAPSDVYRCQWTGWDVRVSNVGNIPSMNVCAIAGITLSAGPGNWASNLGLINFTTPNIAPAASWTFHCNYFIPCGALIGTQYIKTEINYSAGCFDYCTIGSNFDQQAVHVH